jgi:hypothetical protein
MREKRPLPHPPERTFLIGFDDVGALEKEVTGSTEKEAKERAKEAWKKDPLNKPRITYCIEVTGTRLSHARN